MAASKERLVEMTAQIVSAYVTNNAIPRDGIADLVNSISSAVDALGQAAPVQAPKPTPAVNPKRSVFPDYIVCLEDGKRSKSLRRHLQIHFGMSPEEYRAKWGLPPDYPMVAPNYSAARSQLAKKQGFGRKPAPAKKSRAAAKGKTIAKSRSRK